jgi:Protein of unknown function (DUF3485)
MNGITVDEVGSKLKASPKASKEAISRTVVKPPNGVVKALCDAATSARSWTVITCVLLVISGSVRFVRDWGLSNRLAVAQQSPFSLEELPKSLGLWRMVSEGDLDPEIARVAGASDHINRNYINDKTGEVVSVLVLYGLAYALHGHTAEICYPAAGYKAVDSLKTYELKPADLDKTVGYRGGYFAKKKVAADEYDEVIYSFRFVDEWTADPAPKWKLFRRHPGMYKIQIARKATEFAVETSPSVPLLEGFVKEIEKRLSETSAKSGKAAVADEATPR